MAVTLFFFSLSYSSLSPCLVVSKSVRIEFFKKNQRNWERCEQSTLGEEENQPTALLLSSRESR